MLRKCLPLSLAAAAFCAIVGSANAAPVSNLASGMQAATPSAEPVAYRRCWRHHGVLRCRIVRRYYDDDYGYYDYGYSDPYYGYGYGPSIGLSFGGRGGHHGGHHR